MRSSAELSGRRGRGYSLAEVVVSLTVFIALLVGVLLFFNLNFRQARERVDAAQRQEALRSARHDLERLLRMAGRGALPLELAIEVASRVAPGTRIAGPGSPLVVAGTDVLTVRGVFSAPLLQVGPAAADPRPGGGDQTPAGTLEIHDPNPQTGVTQELAELAAAVEAGTAGSETLLLLSQLDESVFATVESDLAAAQILRDGQRVSGVTLPFASRRAATPLAGAGPAAALRGGAFAGILEEYRFYVRQARSAPGDQTSTPRPQLSVARLVPGTDRPWGGSGASLAIDLADHITDLRVTVSDDREGEVGVSVALDGL